MDQPFSRSADMLLDKQYYNPDDPRPYDDVGWTLGPLYNLTTVRIEEPEILSVPMTLMRDSVRAPGGVERISGSGEREAGARHLNTRWRAPPPAYGTPPCAPGCRRA